MRVIAYFITELELYCEEAFSEGISTLQDSLLLQASFSSKSTHRPTPRHYNYDRHRRGLLTTPERPHRRSTAKQRPLVLVSVRICIDLFYPLHI